MNTWRRGPLTRNPYYRTAFRLARLPKEITRRKIVVAMIGQTRRLVNTDPLKHQVGGEPVTPTDLNTAEGILLDPAQRMAEELLEHAEETLPLEPVKKLRAGLAAQIEADAARPLIPLNLEALRPWAYGLAGQFLESCPQPEAALGALELQIIPPFGLAEKE